jgi:DnaD/phage-associated family protein
MFGDPQTVKSIVFPRRKILIQRIEKYLAELELHGLILRYCVNGNQYLWMPNFEKHQVGLRKTQEAQSQIPPCTTESQRSKTVITPTQVKVKVETKVQVKEEVKDTPLNPPTGSLFDPLIAKALKDYEDTIVLPGTVLSAEMKAELLQACQTFSPALVSEAIKEAVKQNQRTWRYIRGILNNWQRKEGTETQ